MVAVAYILILNLICLHSHAVKDTNWTCIIGHDAGWFTGGREILGYQRDLFIFNLPIKYKNPAT